MTDANEDIGWLVKTFQYEDGSGKIFRIRVTPNEAITEERLSTCVILEWPFDDDLPSKELMAHFRLFDNAITELNSEDGDSVLFHIITGGGIREWCYYTTSYEWFLDKFNQLLADHPQYPINIEYQEQTDWNYWRSILEYVMSEDDE